MTEEEAQRYITMLRADREIRENDETASSFVTESNRIEGIIREQQDRRDHPTAQTGRTGGP